MSKHAYVNRNLFFYMIKGVVKYLIKAVVKLLINLQKQFLNQKYAISFFKPVSKITFFTVHRISRFYTISVVFFFLFLIAILFDSLLWMGGYPQ